MPHIVTFHALAYALLRPEEELVFDDEEAESGPNPARFRRSSTSCSSSGHQPCDARCSDTLDSWEAIKQRGLDLDREAFFQSAPKSRASCSPASM